MSHLSLAPNRADRLTERPTVLGSELGEDGPASSTPRGLGHALIRRLDVRLRRGFVEYSQSHDCVLRVALTTVSKPVELADGLAISPGERIIELHFWNERMPQASTSQGLGWGGRFGRRLVQSFRELAAALESDPRLADAVAIRGRLAFAWARDQADMRRFGVKFGFDEAASPEDVSLARRLHDLGEDLWLWALTWTFNPGSLPSRALLRRRDDLWISRAGLLARYGPNKAPRRAL
jgi:hypothetical protein